MFAMRWLVRAGRGPSALLQALPSIRALLTKALVTRARLERVQHGRNHHCARTLSVSSSGALPARPCLCRPPTDAIKAQCCVRLRVTHQTGAQKPAPAVWADGLPRNVSSHFPHPQAQPTGSLPTLSGHCGAVFSLSNGVWGTTKCIFSLSASLCMDSLSASLCLKQKVGLFATRGEQTRLL